MEEPDKKDSAVTKTKKRRKLSRRTKKVLFALIVLLLLVGAAYWFGQRNAKSSTSKATSNLTNSNPYNQASGGNKNSQSRTRKLPPSNGHLTLSGSITEINNKQVSIKTANGDVKTLSVDDKVRVYSTDGKKKTVGDVKSGNNAAITVTVKTDGSFEVELIRVYS